MKRVSYRLGEDLVGGYSEGRDENRFTAAIEIKQRTLQLRILTYRESDRNAIVPYLVSRNRNGLVSGFPSV